MTDTISERHQPWCPDHDHSPASNPCRVCGQSWPCDTANALQQRDKLAEALLDAHERLEQFGKGGRGLMFPGAYALDHAAGTYENCTYCAALDAIKEEKT